MSQPSQIRLFLRALRQRVQAVARAGRAAVQGWRLRARGCEVEGGVDVTGPLPRIDCAGVLVLKNGVRFRTLQVCPELLVGSGGRLVIGGRTYINQGVTIAARVGISIGPDCLIGEYAAIHDTSFHPVAPEEMPKVAAVVIGRNVWIGHRAVVLPGVTIGDHAVVAAGAVVTHDVPARTVVGGVPAVILRTFSCPENWRRP